MLHIFDVLQPCFSIKEPEISFKFILLEPVQMESGQRLQAFLIDIWGQYPIFDAIPKPKNISNTQWNISRNTRELISRCPIRSIGSIRIVRPLPHSHMKGRWIRNPRRTPRTIWCTVWSKKGKRYRQVLRGSV